uniref:Uncharacterized protein n=2 Tax=Pandoraea faecigallinarum TaxID=656179 RepID=A0A0H3WXE8_9BURK
MPGSRRNSMRPGHARHPASGDDAGPSIAKRTAKASVTREPFPRIIEGALKDHSHRTHPRDASAEDHREMLEASM